MARHLAWGGARAAALAAVLAAAFFRSVPLLDNRFHPDEALYGFFSLLIASGRDPLLAGVVVDKPPLSFYLGALGALLFGGGELGARLPAFYAGVISVALTFGLARRLYRASVGAAAAWALALSPLAILFSITVFQDPLLSAFGLWSLWMMALGRPRAAALALALAFSVKQTALLLAPLGLALALWSTPPGDRPVDAVRNLWKAARPMLAGLIIAGLLVFGWDYLRDPAISFWTQGYADNMPDRLIRSSELAPRLRAWLGLLGYLSASPALNAAFAVGLPIWLIAGLRHPSRAGLADLLLAAYLLAYLAGYWLLAFNVWDRYLVMVAPLFAILLARLAAGAVEAIVRRARLSYRGAMRAALPALAVGVMLVPAAVTAARSGFPVGGDHGAYEGIDDAARLLRTLPEGGVLYDHWLSWQWNFYLFGGPLYVSWFPSPHSLAEDLVAFGRASPRYLVVPAWEAEAEVRAAAQAAGFEFARLHSAARRDGSVAFVIYQLKPRRP